jgi:hypothetical protein
MKLVRIGPTGQEQPAVLADDGAVVDLTGVADDIDGALLASGLDEVRQAVAAGDLPPLSPSRTGSARGCGSTAASDRTAPPRT